MSRDPDPHLPTGAVASTTDHAWYVHRDTGPGLPSCYRDLREFADEMDDYIFLDVEVWPKREKR